MGPALLADFQFFLLDNRRSSRDGEELKRIVVAYPAVPRVSDLLWAAGLHSGTAAFARTFGESSGVTRSETHQAVWLNVEVAPGILLALTVSKAALPRHSTEDGLLSIMHQAHQLLVTLHGPLDAFLDSDGGDGVEDERGSVEGLASLSSGDRLRLPLQHFHGELLVPKSPLARELRNPFCSASGLTAAPVSRDTLHAAQALDTALREAGGGAVEGVLVTHEERPAWTSLAEGRAARLALWQAHERLAKGPSALVPGARFDSAPVGSLAVLLWIPGPGAAARLPTLCLGGQESEDRVACVVLCRKTGGPVKCLAVLRPEAVERRGALVIASVLAAAADALMTRLAREWGGEPLLPQHVHGFRFRAARYGLAGETTSTRQKVSAMTHADRAVAGSLRDTLARRRPLREPDSVPAEDEGRDTSQVIVRAVQGESWVVARTGLQSELLAVRQLSSEPTVRQLLPVVEALAHQLHLGD
ncbi:hypothetical protein QBZ16_000345 [Prototheca wickerhamii]|uniref:CCZ1/INTU/HSP4 first Longin domain-containing protein n=1 Tax=Prototheca wickerhamii TaxID=3111 RepID=A0AAD9MJV0_PROWI|nr:hypothetical protein QBZ16_000345 [Prototheca wickerhamii]